MLLLVTLTAVLAQTAATTARSAPASAATRKVMWIVMENRSYGAVVGATTAAPYINGTLIPRGGDATNMHNESHPSLPNYIAMTTGDTQGIADDSGPSYHPYSGQSIFSQTDPSWRAYEEVMPSKCYRKNATFSNGTNYVVRHNPATYMVAAPINAPNSDCNLYDEPLGTASLGNLNGDLAGGTLPAFSFVTPGICHDMHTAPSGQACNPTNAITAGDQWLSTLMPQVFASPDYTSGALVVFLTWDEGAGGAGVKGMDCLGTQYATDVGCHIPTLVFSTSTTGGTRNGTYFSHYSMLRTTEELLGVSTSALGSNVSTATSMRAAFNL
ncbi:MAG: alkaline phosphatase family protein [Pseudonocardiales bacterium]